MESKLNLNIIASHKYSLNEFINSHLENFFSLHNLTMNKEIRKIIINNQNLGITSIIKFIKRKLLYGN